ncbi:MULTISPECIES: VanZ family protein [Glutamicibacter]|uniref:VanZ family protein n=1 Tax=Glutamicibacter TaxID=1742989 RepID=UPI00257E895C|nr:VanZ family protein [Glutamicibacter sp.]
MTTSHQKFTITVFIAYLIAVLLIGFWPTPVDRPLAGALTKGIAWLHRHGMPGFIGYSDIEFVANVVFFIPMGIITTLWNKNPMRSVAIGTYASLSIELLQELVLPQRYPSVFDIIANTIGAAIGAFLLHPLIAWLIARHDSRALALEKEYDEFDDLMESRPANDE